MDYLTRLLRKNGSLNQGDKTIVEAVRDDSSTCGSKSETESPASSTPSRLDTTTDDYESADEGPSSPTREVDLSVLANQLETLSLGTPAKSVSGQSGVVFPFSPLENSILISSPGPDDEPFEKTVIESPISQDGSPHNSSSPEFIGGVNFEERAQEPVFKVPDGIPLRHRPSVDLSFTTCRSDDSFASAVPDGIPFRHRPSADLSFSTCLNDDSFVSAASTFRSPGHDHNSTLVKNADIDQIQSPSHVEESQPANAPSQSETATDPTQFVPKSPVSDFIANADRECSPLATQIQNIGDEELNASLTPIQVDVSQVTSTGHSIGSCKKDILLASKDEQIPEKLGDHGLSGVPTELEIAGEIVDSCISAATSSIVPNGAYSEKDSKVFHSNPEPAVQVYDSQEAHSSGKDLGSESKDSTFVNAILNKEPESRSLPADDSRVPPESQEEIPKSENDTESTAQSGVVDCKPDSDVEFSSSSELNHEVVVAHIGNNIKEDASPNIPKGTVTDNAEVVNQSDVHGGIIEVQKSGDGIESTPQLPGAVPSELRSYISSELTHASEAKEDASPTIPKEIVIDQAEVVHQSEVNSSECASNHEEQCSQILQSPVGTESLANDEGQVKEAENIGYSANLENGKGTSLGESFVVMNNDSQLPKVESEANEFIKVDFSRLPGSVEEIPCQVVNIESVLSTIGDSVAPQESLKEVKKTENGGEFTSQLPGEVFPKPELLNSGLEVTTHSSCSSELNHEGGVAHIESNAEDVASPSMLSDQVELVQQTEANSGITATNDVEQSSQMLPSLVGSNEERRGGEDTMNAGCVVKLDAKVSQLDADQVCDSHVAPTSEKNLGLEGKDSTSANAILNEATTEIVLSTTRVSEAPSESLKEVQKSGDGIESTSQLPGAFSSELQSYISSELTHAKEDASPTIPKEIVIDQVDVVHQSEVNSGVTAPNHEEQCSQTLPSPFRIENPANGEGQEKKAENVGFSVKAEFGKGISLGESFVVMKNNSPLPEEETKSENEFIKVDFSRLTNLDQDLKSESMNFYSSPESTADQYASSDKGEAMNQSYKDLSKILATCSKQEQELGGQTFDFSCIQAEAAKIAIEITHSSPGRSNPQPMMHSVLSAESNNSEAGPVTADEDFNKEEFFQNVTDLDFECLARAGSTKLLPSKLARQSLYVKFDPLVGKIIASSEDSDSSLVAAMGDNHQISGEEGKLNITPPSHSESDERIINITPTSARKENLQSGGGYTPILRQEISKLQELMIQQEQAHQEKTDLVEQLRSRIAELEMANSGDLSDSRTLEQQLKAKDDELKLVHDELEKSRVSNKQLVQVMEEYEKTISQLVTVKEETKAQMEKDKETIAAERDTALQHLSNMEVAFNDIHQKYERAKTVIETLHANEKELKKSYDAVVETVEAQNTAYQKLKQHAAEKLSAANAEIEKIHKEYNGEMARMKAVARKNELKCKSLEESLEQKKKELRELTQICDELIANHTPS